MNNFQRDLEYSHDLNESNSFDIFYRRFFYNVKEIKTITDLRLQKMGIDKIVVLKSGKKILIDEKKRRVDYGDILLEEYSDFDNKVPGWLHKNKYTDYVAYAIIPVNKIYFLPFQILRATMKRNYKNWLAIYGRKFADNGHYRTSNMAIPKDILLDELRTTMIDNTFIRDHGGEE